MLSGQEFNPSPGGNLFLCILVLVFPFLSGISCGLVTDKKQISRRSAEEEKNCGLADENKYQTNKFINKSLV